MAAPLDVRLEIFNCHFSIWILAAAGVSAAEPAAVGPPMRLGHVEFAASGAAAAQPDFQHGVAALHSFWYDEALAAFQRVLARDPDFAMAWWGIAMTYHRPYLPGSDDVAGRAALAHVRDTSRLTPREVAYIEALRTYYASTPWAERTLAYAAAMEKLHRDYPDDPEAAAFCALALLGYGWTNDEGFARQERAAALAGEVFHANPNHPGAAHYLIHSLDDPSLAARGLDAARHYAGIAPDAPHALHMPSHIFLQLGLWRDVASSNDAAWVASEKWVAQQRLDPTHRDYHNLHWLIYACLQQGRYARAAELVRTFQAMRADISPESRHFLDDALASYVLETREWPQAEKLFAAASPSPMASRRAALAPNGQRLEFCGGPPSDDPTTRVGADMPAFVRAFAAAADGASDAERRLAELRQAATVNNTIARFWRIRTLEVDALRRSRLGQFDRALAAVREATTLEDESGPSSGPPSSIKPPHELAGEILAQAGRPADAVAEFDRALARHRNRALALLGRARAHAAIPAHAGDAAEDYARFLETWRDADANRPELREARDYLTAKPKRP